MKKTEQAGGGSVSKRLMKTTAQIRPSYGRRSVEEGVRLELEEAGISRVSDKRAAAVADIVKRQLKAAKDRVSSRMDEIVSS